MSPVPIVGNGLTMTIGGKNKKLGSVEVYRVHTVREVDREDTSIRGQKRGDKTTTKH